MKSKAIVSAIAALSLTAGGFAFGQGNEDRHDRSQAERRPPGIERVAERGAGPDHAFHKGGRLPNAYHQKQYVIDDWRGHHLSAPPRGYHWVQTGSDYVLVAITTGIILQLLLH